MTDRVPPPGGDDPTPAGPGQGGESGSDDATLELPEVPGSPGPDDATLIQPSVPPPGVDPTLVQGSVPPPPPPPPVPPQPEETPWWRRWWAIALWVVLAALLVFAIARATSDDDTPASSTTSTSSTSTTSSTQPSDTSTSAAPTSTTAAPSTTTTTLPATTTTAAPATTTTQPPPEALFSDGTHVVGTDIEAGTYETGVLAPLDPGADPACSWRRLSGTGGTDEEIIADVGVDTHGIVEVIDTDAALVTSGCGDWFALTALPTLMDDIPPGTWAVDIQVASGRYAAPGGDSCSWARLSSFTGEPDAVIDGDDVDGSVIVDVDDGDAGFTSTGCGTWTPVS
jgi:hypothetical protein